MIKKTKKPQKLYAIYSDLDDEFISTPMELEELRASLDSGDISLVEDNMDYYSIYEVVLTKLALRVRFDVENIL